MSELDITCGDALDELRKLPSESVHCCVTSPPYWGLRDYGTAQWEGGDDSCDHRGRSQTSDASTLAEWKNGGGQRYKEETGGMPYAHECGKCGAKRIDSQIGLEKTPEEYVAKMVEVFREVRRVLRKDGTLWLNLGDSYNTSPAGNTKPRSEGGNGAGKFDFHGGAGQDNYFAQRNQKGGIKCSGLKPKDLCGIPWRVAFALQADGWWLRSDIIWSKPNPMPESVTDRPTKSHEYIFLLTKSASYFWDAEAIKEPNSPGSTKWGLDVPSATGNAQGNGRHGSTSMFSKTLSNAESIERYYTNGRNKRSVWTIATQPYPEAHFATFPEELPKLCILAGTSAKGCCAKCGSPWGRIVENRDELRQSVSNPKAEVITDNGDRRDGRSRTRVNTPEYGHAFVSTSGKTIGWQPTCNCGQFIVTGDGILRESEQTIPCTVLDPFAGSGTTGKVAIELGRKAILIELNPKYVELIKERCNVTPGLQLA